MGFPSGAIALSVGLLVSHSALASNPPPDPCSLLLELNEGYLAVHVPKERAFWASKMGHSSYLEGTLERREEDYRAFISDPTQLPRIRAALARPDLGISERVGLEGWLRFFETNVIESPQAKAIFSRLLEVEARIAKALREAPLGYRDPESGELVPARQTALALKVATDPDERVRKAAWEGLREVEKIALEAGFPEALKLRNRFAQALGYRNFYDYKIKTTEGISLEELFEVLQDLERKTRLPSDRAARELVSAKGVDALRPWNFGYAIAGDLKRERDPYLRLERALDLWGRSFAALGITYRGATLRLDLVDRKGKYQNGFMHGPFPGFVDRGLFRPSEVSFTANAIPGAVGSGAVAINTLFHEGGHAAHFSNILMPSPAFSQEFAPTSVALAELQSMFLDSLTGDPQWLARYALDRDGKPMPRELILRGVREGQPYKAYRFRSMLAVPFAERELYALKERDMTPARILEVLRDVEADLLPTEESSRPLLAVPHLLDHDTSAYYHAYVMAELAVYQTYRHFKRNHGYVVDNPRVGSDLARVYWNPGNSRSFFELVKELTGKPFSAEAAIESVSLTVEEAVRRAELDLDAEPTIPRFEGPVRLDATVHVVHGDELIGTTAGGMSFEDLSARFAEWAEAQEVQRRQHQSP